VKPANLMLLPDGGVKVLDFGLAKLAGQTTRTQDGSTLGTVAYMSPEQASGAKVDARTDVWSLGAVLYEMVTGRVPFEGDYAQAVIYGILNHDPVAPSKIKPDISPELERVILLCLAKEPDQRIQTMAELAAELGEAGVTGPVTPGRSMRPARRRVGRAGAWLRRRRWAALLALLFVIAAAGITYWQWPRKVAPVGPWRPVRMKLAVLPFANLGAPDKEHVTDGVTEEITGRLAQVYGLNVAARTSVEESKATKKKAPQIASELGVDYLLEGSVRWQGGAAGAETIRVAAKLIRAADGTHLWNEQYDETAADILGKQSLIADKVAVAMREKLVDGERKGMAAVSTRSAAAYEYYKKGLEQKKLDDALKMFERAAALDPGFVEAQAAIARTHGSKYYSREDHSEKRWAQFTAALERARGLDPEHPDVHIALSEWYFTKSEFQMAEEECRRAKEGRPGDLEILSLLAHTLSFSGKWRERLQVRERNADLHPRDISTQGALAFAYASHQRYAEAERVYRRAMAMDPERQAIGLYFGWARIFTCRDGNPQRSVAYLENQPATLRKRAVLEEDFLLYLWMAGQGERVLTMLPNFREVLLEVNHWFWLKSEFQGDVLRSMGRLDESRKAYVEALHQVETRLKEEPEQLSYMAARGHILAGMGRKAEAIRDSRQALASSPPGIPFLRQTLTLAVVYTIVEEYDLAIEQLDILLANPWTTNLNTVRCTPTFRPLLSLPRFKALEKKYPPDKPYAGEWVNR
jgi:non-specific serine/threonine protein kinase